MGKGGDQHSITVATQSTERNAENGCRDGFKLVRFRCVFALLLGVGVLLSAIFFLPPFFRNGDLGNLDLISQFRGHDIVASFKLEKPVSLLEDNILQLEDDIFDEIGGVATTKVEIISLESSVGSNITKVIFAVGPDDKNSRVSSAAKSLVRANFVSLIIRQLSLRLTASLFGEAFSFDVLKFTGGITVSPPQSAFLLQKVQILFNFTLNFSIDQIQDNFNELAEQLKSGLHLAPYENLYISLTNSRGSTVSPPTTVQSSVLLAVGNTPSLRRLKQLAQTITGSHSKNLGLNNTEFGRVKQVRLSSILQHSLHGADGSAPPSPSPSPMHHPHNHHHHHHHHHNHHDTHLPPAYPPAPAPAPAIEKGSPAPATSRNHEAKPPSCHFGFKKRYPRKANKHPHLVPPVASPVSAPVLSPHYAAPSPHQQVNPPPSVAPLVPSSSPLPNVVFTRTHPPSKGDSDAEPPDITPSVSPLQASSSAGISAHLCAILLFLGLVLHL